MALNLDALDVLPDAVRATLLPVGCGYAVDDARHVALWCSPLDADSIVLVVSDEHESPPRTIYVAHVEDATASEHMAHALSLDTDRAIAAMLDGN